MLRAIATACSRASTSAPTHVVPAFLLPSFTSAFHTSASRSANRNKDPRVQKKRNTEFRLQRAERQRRDAPHPVLGVPDTAEGEAVWRSCDLARILVDEAALEAAPVRPLVAHEIILPDQYAFSIAEPDERFLFKSLPYLSAKREINQVEFMEGLTYLPADMESRADMAMAAERLNANFFSRIVDLKNANAKGISVENKRRCIEVFGTKPGDSGRPEVQAAVLTVQIRSLWQHVKDHKKDVHCQRGLKALVHKRAAILKYLERIDPARFDALLPRLGLEARAVRGEIIVKFK